MHFSLKKREHCFQSTNFLVKQFGGSCFYHADKIEMQITSSEEGNFPQSAELRTLRVCYIEFLIQNYFCRYLGVFVFLLKASEGQELTKLMNNT